MDYDELKQLDQLVSAFREDVARFERLTSSGIAAELAAEFLVSILGMQLELDDAFTVERQAK